MIRQLTLFIFLAITYSSAKAQHPNQWILSETLLLDFSTSPPSLVSIPDTLTADTPFNYRLNFQHVKSHPDGGLKVFSVLPGHLGGISAYTDKFKEVPLSTSWNRDSFRFGNFFDSYNRSKVSFRNGVSYQRLGLLKNRNSINSVLQIYENTDSLHLKTLDQTSSATPYYDWEHQSLIYNGDSSFFNVFVAQEDDRNEDLHIRCAQITNDGIVENIRYHTLTQHPRLYNIDLHPSHQSSTLAISANISREDRLSPFAFYYYKIEDEGDISLLDSVIFAEGYEYPGIIDGSFSPNDSFLYTSLVKNWGIFENQLGTTLGRYNRFSGQIKIEEIPLPDSTKIMRFGLGPNGKLYFQHIMESEPKHFGLGVIHNPDEPDKDKLEIELSTIKEPYESEFIYHSGFKPPKHLGVPLVRYKVKQQHCRHPYLTTHNYSDPEFVDFEWDLFTLDTVLVQKIQGRTARLTPDTSGTYLVRLRGQDAFGKKSWRWQKVAYQKPFPLDFTVGLDTACLWTDVALEAVSPKKEWGQTVFTWNFFRNDSLLKTDTGRVLSTQFSRAGVYHIQLSATLNGCTDSLRKTAPLVLVDAPEPGFTLSHDTLCTPQSVTLTHKKLDRADSIRYQWSDGLLFAQPEGHTRTFSRSGKYRVKQSLYGRNGCVTHFEDSIRVHKGVTIDSVPLLYLATVQNTKSIKLEWKPLFGIQIYELNRLTDNFTAYITQDSISSYVDTLADSILNSYAYTLRAIDSCKQKSALSATAKTIYLQATNHQNQYTVLNWTAYEHWAEGVSEYSLQSSVDGENWLTLEGLKGLSYTDTRIPPSEQEYLFYRVVATAQGSEPWVSHSNTAEVLTATTIFIPNAFTPNGDGVNDVFSAGAFGLESFECRVFAQNGQQVAYSTDAIHIWDGTSTISSTTYPVGAYTYIIKAKSTKGEDMQVTGSVILLK